MSNYAIWNKKDSIITPTGQVYTAEQWMDKYPVAKLEHIDVLCAAGEINGAIFGTLGSLVEQYKAEGADFSSCTTAEEKLAVINAFDEEKEIKYKEESQNYVSNEELTATSLASIAASLEYQNLMTLEDVEV